MNEITETQVAYCHYIFVVASQLCKVLKLHCYAFLFAQIFTIIKKRTRILIILLLSLYK